MSTATLSAAPPLFSFLPPGAAGHYRVGMPQLGLNGLSESWLLAECGDRHWQLLAQACGMPVSQLRDARHRRVYPAFRSVRLRHAELDAVLENDQLEIASSLGRVSRTQFYSKHVVSSAHGLRAVVDMLSAFVARERAGDNTSAARSAVSGFDAVPPLEEGERFAAHNRAWLQARREGDAARNGRPAHSYAPQAIRPCPSVHFNGAGFLYFARFHELVDHAEAAWFGPWAARCVTTERHTLYHGNADVGSTLSLQLCEFERHGSQLDHHAQIVRSDDHRVIADVTTRRRLRQPGADFLETLFEKAG
ncbi:hypothetical protein GPA19_07080 [Azoarcus indigens]|uniref:Putative biosynthetic protein (TIGR04099 family) n=1 Tax=Azoarcus indigens TaxID=29545 RepID=A0A4R6DZT5_9RHOO|nr:Pnap_2097 family protein [Azoarcus indigens]NMG64708.1 hypothetical protein [Azoarcus indigens]TDN50907.1 putative biosynthetic protein (TIGR04099 family) [Azoarcus indigens]